MSDLVEVTLVGGLHHGKTVRVHPLAVTVEMASLLGEADEPKPDPEGDTPRAVSLLPGLIEVYRRADEHATTATFERFNVDV